MLVKYEISIYDDEPSWELTFGWSTDRFGRKGHNFNWKRARKGEISADIE